MNQAHLHLLLNHVPPLGTLFALVLLVIAGLRRSDEMFRGALILLVVVGLAAIPTYLTGEPAEDQVMGMPGVVMDAIHRHEDSAKASLAAAVVLGIIAAAGLHRYPAGTVSRAFAILVLVLTLIAAGLLGRTAHLGGGIHHPEIGAAAAHSEDDH